MTDHELIALVAERSEDAFNQIYEKWNGPLRSYILGKTGDVDRTDQVLAWTWSQAFMKAHLFRPTHALSTWIFTIAMNRIRNEYRRAKRLARPIPIDPAPDDDDVAPVDPADESRWADPAARIEGRKPSTASRR